MNKCTVYIRYITTTSIAATTVTAATFTYNANQWVRRENEIALVACACYNNKQKTSTGWCSA